MQSVIVRAAPATDPDAGPSNGTWAHQRLEQSVRRLVELQAPVLEDGGDPEPLHRMRVAMRRLRTLLRQFGPALVLPGGVGDGRIAKAARRLGMARDLDVLRARLDQELIPQLPEEEARALRPVLRQLRRERRLAGEQLAETLTSGGYLKLLERLQGWLKQPAFTPLGCEPVAAWQVEWQAPLLSALAVHPGWFVEEVGADPESVHDLRKQCKSARYCLENLQPLNGEAGAAWVRRFQGLQDLLGELNDLEVLRRAIDDQLPGRLTDSLPQLNDLLANRSADCWSRWREQARELQRPHCRHGLMADLLGTPEEAEAGASKGS